MNINNNKIYYWLTLADVSTLRQNKLLEIYDSPMQLWERFETDIKIKEFIGDKNYDALKRFKNLDYIDSSLDSLVKQNIRLLTKASNKYPLRLNQFEVCPPNVLYYKGDIDLLETDCVAMVGTRHSSNYGKECAKKIAKELTDARITVVSGLAMGIDSFSHKAALDNNGKTIAVLGSGLNKITPVNNYGLSEEIIENGLIITEYKPNFEGAKYSFPERNRIVSGVSLGVVVVEAGEKSGTFITVGCALDQGREVYAVPGNINSPKSFGTNQLIREGKATFILSGEDVCNDLKIEYVPKEKKLLQIKLDISEEKIYNTLLEGQKNYDDLVILTGMSI